MKHSIRRVMTLSIAMTLAAMPTANAFWGIGDVTFDPSSYAALGENLAQLKNMYDTMMKQFDRLDKMQQTIAKASEAYDRLTNLDLHQMADGLTPGRYMKNARGLEGIQAARSEITRIKGDAQGNVYMIKDQLSRLDDLEQMVGLQAVAANNAKKSSTDLDQRQTSQITAQSTSVLAALATAEEQRRQAADVAASVEHARQTDLTHKSVELYQSMSSK